MTFWRRRHPVRDEELSAYVDGELDADRRAQVEAHVKSCDACRTALVELRGLSTAIAQQPRAAAPRSFALREADVDPAPRRAAPGVAGAPALLGGVATFAAVAFGVLVGIDLAGTSGSEPEMLSGFEGQQGASLEDSGWEPLPEADGDYGAADELAETPAGAAPDGDAEAPTHEIAEPSLSSRAGDGELTPLADDGADQAERAADDGGGGSQALRIAEALTAALALVAGGSLALVWWRRRA